MKKIFTLLFSALFFLAFGQTQLENPGFEGSWENVAGSEDEPAQWNSLKTADALTLLAPIVAFKSTDAHSGNYSIRLKNKLTAGVVANGIITNGRVHASLDPENGYVYTESSNSDWCFPFTDRPDSLVAWYKYFPLGGDKGKVEILLHTGTSAQLPESGSTSHWVGKAKYIITDNTLGTWKRLSVPFNYYNSNTPSYALIVATSGDSTLAVDGSEMWLDDIELIYNPVGIETSELPEPITRVYKHQGGFNASLGAEKMVGATLNLFGLDGRLMYSTKLNTINTYHELNQKGVFVYQIHKNNTTFTGKLVL